jgi:hypothetical protein
LEAKENEERDRKIAAANKKADTAMRKAQTALDRAQRREATQATRELKAEFERLAKVHRSLDKK